MFDLYLALGDSMSIDFYPAQDALKRGLSQREELGAASLLYKNDAELFPEFNGKDLSSIFPGIRYENLAFDGATTEDWLSAVRINDLEKHSKLRTLVTLTLGGNDLLQTFRWNASKGEETLAAAFQGPTKRFANVIDLIQQKMPRSILVVSTVFDPTDGTGIIPVQSSLYDKPLPIEYLALFNNFVSSMRQKQLIFVADVQKHFEGHGAACGEEENFWYWKPSPIEPSYKGASEIRRVLLDTIMTIPETKSQT